MRLICQCFKIHDVLLSFLLAACVTVFYSSNINIDASVPRQPVDYGNNI